MKTESVVLLTKISYVTLHYKLWLRLVNILIYLLIVDSVYKENTKYCIQCNPKCMRLKIHLQINTAAFFCSAAPRPFPKTYPYNKDKTLHPVFDI